MVSRKAVLAKDRIDVLDEQLYELQAELDKIKVKILEGNEEIQDLHETIRSETGCDCYALGIKCECHEEEESQ